MIGLKSLPRLRYKLGVILIEDCVCWLGKAAELREHLAKLVKAKKLAELKAATDKLRGLQDAKAEKDSKKLQLLPACC